MVEPVIPPTEPDEAAQLRQLLPEPRSIKVRELLESLTLDAVLPAERPYTVANFVAGADGRAAFQGHSRALSDATDRDMFHGLREHVDAILVGTGTLRSERYGRLVKDPVRRRRRAASGLSPEPLACIITRGGDVPLDIPLFADPAARIVVFTPSELDTSALGAEVDVVRLDPGELTLTTVMRRLRSAYDVRTVLCEGGPTLFGALLREDLVDELFLTLAPKLTGGGGAPTITSGPELAEPRTLTLMWALERGSGLYLRYELR
jgi:riboflavin-specific deaminase-like protein